MPAAAAAAMPTDISLNGTWQTAIDRAYDTQGAQTIVPGLAQSPAAMSPGTLWYRRTVQLPAGDWDIATLTLKGARFAPEVYVDSQLVSSSEGGMAPTTHVLASPHIAPGKTVTLEIALKSLKDLSTGDASNVPTADRWRADLSSDLWDDVTLHFSKTARISRIIPFTDFNVRKLTVHFATTPESADASASAAHAQTFLLNANASTSADTTTNTIVAQSARAALTDNSRSDIALPQSVRPWTSDAPTLYRLRLDLTASDGTLLDRVEIPYGLRDFRTDNAAHGFLLNNTPVHLRAASVVWHRWLRDPEARTIAFDTAWFERNIVLRLKSLGANAIRFHLGLPPESFLDLCDRHGLLVQLEWPFFHGIKADATSMTAQWRAWLDVAMRHPSIAIVHAWNETEGDELTRAWSALNAILPEYPPLVVGHRDVIHIHKYWWSLFENVGLYYDSAAQFDRPIMVDEFGGNYLDGNLAPGAYPSVRESFLRFLGRDNTAAQRLRLHTLSNARIAEYWRRLGAAGLSPFVALSSPEDGNHWFLGPLAGDPQTGLANPKPVWPALAASFAPLSVSLDIWDGNFIPGQQITVPLHFFNETDTAQTLTAEITVVPDPLSQPSAAASISAKTPSIIIHKTEIVNPHATRITPITLTLPATTGTWLLRATLTAPQNVITAGIPIVSEWPIRTLEVKIPDALKNISIGVPAGETELRAFLTHHNLRVVASDDPSASVIVTSTATAARLRASAPLRETPSGSGINHSTFYILHSVQKHQSLVVLDLGPRDLGQSGPLDGAPRVSTPKVERWQILPDVTLTFTEAPEPESCLHPSIESDALWTRPGSPLPRKSTQLWNGLRGGLLVPAAEMDVSGLGAPAFLALWQNRGADPDALRSGKPFYACELAGYYAYSDKRNDKDTIAALRKKVQFLFDDAPALQGRINPRGPVATIDLAKLYRESQSNGGATRLTPLANAGKNLTRVPVVALDYGPGQGRIILSQLLTAGRLAPTDTNIPANVGGYAIRPDPAAQQLVLNLLAESRESSTK